MKKIIAATALLAGLFVSSAAFAECTTDVKKDDLTSEQVQGLYDCIKEELRAGYASKDGEHTKEYQGWKAASTLPAVAGVLRAVRGHQGLLRLLQHRRGRVDGRRDGVFVFDGLL